MKQYFPLLCMLLSTLAYAQQDTAVHTNSSIMKHAAYQKGVYSATIAVGFIDGYRQNIEVPAAFKAGSTSGFSPFYARVENGLSDHISLAAAFAYDAFVYSFSRIYTGNSGTILRYKQNDTRVLTGGLTAYYHFTTLFHSSRVDPFIGIGISLNNVRYSAYPEGDSTIVKTGHTIVPLLKAGARYYLSDAFSLYGDVGYDKQSIFSVGVSCRFL